MLKRVFIGLAGLVVLGLLGFIVLAWQSAIAPIAAPSGELFAGAGREG